MSKSADSDRKFSSPRQNLRRLTVNRRDSQTFHLERVEDKLGRALRSRNSRSDTANGRKAVDGARLLQPDDSDPDRVDNRRQRSVDRRFSLRDGLTS